MHEVQIDTVGIKLLQTFEQKYLNYSSVAKLILLKYAAHFLFLLVLVELLRKFQAHNHDIL